MKPQEKKYRVSSFANTEQILKKVGAKKVKEIVSTHYYGQHKGNDVEKFVEYADRCEIHVLKEQDGKFTMTEHGSIANKDEGFTWLKTRGFTTAHIVTMAYTEYEYKERTVGLYVIDDFLTSVILCYLPEKLSELEKEFELEHAEVIALPYNKYLDQLGKLRTLKLV